MNLRIEPRLDATRSQVLGWSLYVKDLPPLEGKSWPHIRYATRVRTSAIKSFIRAALAHGGPEALASRHWWTPELEDEIAQLRVLLLERLQPLVELCLDSDDWLNEVPQGSRLHNPNIVGQLLARHFPATE